MENNHQQKVENVEKYQLKPLTRRENIFYGFGPLADQMSHQMFQFLLFTYYYTWVGLGVYELTFAFTIFAIWDSINDPIIGVLTDRTQSKMGKRKLWIVLSIIPFALINIFIFTPPFFMFPFSWSFTLIFVCYFPNC